MISSSLISQPLSFFLLGLCVENCLFAILSLLPRVVTIFNASERRVTPAIFYLIFALNASLLLYDVTGFYVAFNTTVDICRGVYKINNLFWHLFFIGFASFMLWKSWIVTDKNRVFLIFAVSALLYRTIWGIIDLAWSGGYWDAEIGCYYDQNGVSALHGAIGDVACDCIATIGSLTMFLKQENRELPFQSLWYQLAKENVVRSIVTLMVTCTIIYLDHASVHPAIFYIAYSVQEYTYIRLANVEIKYKRRRASLNSSLRAGRLSQIDS
ncbi:hypothetical protein BDR26DRAFT_849807 [Obelidium mucronatum]|nr:hypothetical protein BDR26DRAFT_849807 [Obelidium mucronatum]